jgi:RNA polymerase primary sigma factor
MRQLKIIKQVTNRETPSLDKYLHDIGKIDLITAEEEVDLARRIHNGDIKARDRLVNANLRFVVSVSKQYQNQGLSLPDMINEGNLGLIKAAQRFDETRGFKFISYAVWWIRQSIMQAIAEHTRIVRLPLNRIGCIKKINRIFSELEQKFEREPSVLEIAQALDLEPKDVKEALKISGRHVSMDAPINPDDEGNMYNIILSDDIPAPDRALVNESLLKEIERALSTLTEREANIVRLSFGINGKHPHSLEEIGEVFNITRERVRQIKEKAIRRLGHISRCKLLRNYMG